MRPMKFLHSNVSILLAAVALIASPCLGSEQKAREYIQQAREAGKHRLWNKATTLCRSALDEARQEDPDSLTTAEAAFFLTLFQERGQPEMDTLALYEDAIRIHRLKGIPEPHQLSMILQYYSEALVERKHPAEAERAIREALKLSEDDAAAPKKFASAELLVTLGRAQQLQEKWKEAEASYRQAYALQSASSKESRMNLSRTRAYLAHLLDFTGRYREAELLMRENLAVVKQELSPDSPIICHQTMTLANVLEKQEHWDEALALGKSALEMTANSAGPESPENISVMRTVAGMYFHRRQFTEMLDLLRNAEKIAATAGDSVSAMEIKCAIGEAQLYMGKFAEAKQSLDGALALDEKRDQPTGSRSAWTYTMLGHWNCAQGLHAESMACFDKAAAIEPDNTTIQSTRARHLYLSGRWREAVQLFDAQLPKMRESDYSHIIRFLAQTRMGERDKAAAVLRAHLKERKVQLDSDWPATVMGFLLGDVSETHMLEAAKSPHPITAANRACEGNYYAGFVRMQQGNKEGARKLYKASLDTKCVNFIEYEAAEMGLLELETGTR